MIDALERLELKAPELTAEERSALQAARKQLESEG